MKVTREEVVAQKTHVESLRAAINSEVMQVQAVMESVNAAKAKIGNMQVDLMVEERILARMEKAGEGDGSD